MICMHDIHRQAKPQSKGDVGKKGNREEEE
jgi:hypothetical protein